MSNFLNSALHRHLFRYALALIIGGLGILAFSSEVHGEPTDQFCSPVAEEIQAFLKTVELRKKSFEQDLDFMSEQVLALYGDLQSYESKVLKLDNQLMGSVETQVGLLTEGAKIFEELSISEDEMVSDWFEKLENCGASESIMSRTEEFGARNSDFMFNMSIIFSLTASGLDDLLQTYRNWELEGYQVKPGDFDSLKKKAEALGAYYQFIDDNYKCAVEPLLTGEYECSFD